MLPVVGLRKSRGGGRGTIRRSTFTENFASRTGGAFSLAARAKLDIDAATSVECNMASSGGAFAASPDASAAARTASRAFTKVNTFTATASGSAVSVVQRHRRRRRGEGAPLVLHDADVAHVDALRHELLQLVRHRLRPHRDHLEPARERLLHEDEPGRDRVDDDKHVAVGRGAAGGDEFGPLREGGAEVSHREGFFTALQAGLTPSSPSESQSWYADKRLPRSRVTLL